MARKRKSANFCRSKKGSGCRRRTNQTKNEKEEFQEKTLEKSNKGLMDQRERCTFYFFQFWFKNRSKQQFLCNLFRPTLSSFREETLIRQPKHKRRARKTNFLLCKKMNVFSLTTPPAFLIKLQAATKVPPVCKWFQKTLANFGFFLFAKYLWPTNRPQSRPWFLSLKCRIAWKCCRCHILFHILRCIGFFF